MCGPDEEVHAHDDLFPLGVAILWSTSSDYAHAFPRHQGKQRTVLPVTTATPPAACSGASEASCRGPAHIPT